MRAQFGPILVAVVAALWSSTSAPAAVCDVPSAPHPTIQEAVDDISCTEIVLAAQTFVESVNVGRSLEIRGVSSATTIIEGRVVVEGAAAQVDIEDLKIDGSALTVAGCFPEALVAQGGARIDAGGVVVVNGDGDACILFGDGFETGDTSAWSETMP